MSLSCRVYFCCYSLICTWIIIIVISINTYFKEAGGAVPLACSIHCKFQVNYKTREREREIAMACD